MYGVAQPVHLLKHNHCYKHSIGITDFVTKSKLNMFWILWSYEYVYIGVSRQTDWSGVKCQVHRETQLVGAQFSRRAGIRRPKIVRYIVFSGITKSGTARHICIVIMRVLTFLDTLPIYRRRSQLCDERRLPEFLSNQPNRLVETHLSPSRCRVG